jgi:DNA polymerase family A
MLRAKYMWPIAHHERRGIPTDMPKLDRIRSHWNGMKADLVYEKNEPFGVYEMVDGVPHWRKQLFANYVHRNRMAWPTLASGVFDESDEAFKTMEGRYPQVRELRQLRYSLSKLKLHELQVGGDGRNRTVLGVYGTKTARNAPSNAKFIFGPAKWLRFLIAPPPSRVLVHRDYSQQEVHIAAVVSGDAALLQACQTGDVYLGVAKQLGLAPEDATPKTHKPVRALFKTVVLGILYGLGPRTLALQTGVSLFEAAELLARLRARFRTFEDFVQCALDHAGLLLEIGTPFGWTMQCPPTINPRTIRNFPIQSTAAEILHVACILAERRGIHIVATVHDALMAEADLGCTDATDAALSRVMRDASSLVLRGYELSTDKQIIYPGERFHDDKGVEMWGTVEWLLAKLETRSA